MSTLNKAQRLNKRSKGFSLMELIMVVGAIAVLLAIAFAGYSMYQKKSNVTKVVKAVATIDNCISERYASWRDYSGLNNTTLLSGVCIPDELKTNTAGQISNPWSATGVVVTTISANTIYSIQQNSIPDDECVEIAMKLNPQSANFIELRINGSAVNSPANIASGCNAGSGNSLEWRNR